jgi:hypothetical protein
MTRILTLLAALAALLPGAAAAEPTQASWWYAVDHVTSVAEDSRVLVWATLPADWHGQEVTIEAIVPEPVAVMDDPESGNRVVEWLVEPEAGTAPGQVFFHVDFNFTEKPIRLDIDPAAVKPYDRESELFRRYTRAETWIQTEGLVLDQARRIVGKETNPWLQAGLVYDWIVAETAYDAPGPKDRDAQSVLEARRGDCGHVSILMTAMLRSLGIPARTVTTAWLTGGDHVFLEFWLEGYGWVPADPSLGQMIDLDYPGFTPRDIERVMAGRNIELGDSRWLLGNLFDSRMICTVGNNIRFDSPTLGRAVTLQRMEPGGAAATPSAAEITGLNRDIVHGGFWVFGKRLANDEEAHAATHQKLANLFFRTGLFDIVEETCLASIQEYTDAVQSWINMGKVYLHKGDYYKAEAAFRKAQLESSDKRNEHLEAFVWTHIYLGNCYDLLNKREMALQEYQAVIDLDIDFRGSLDLARHFLHTPFTKERANRL